MESVVRSVVGSGSIFFNYCAHLVHIHCSGPNSILDNVIDFKCRTYLNPTIANDDDKKVRLGKVEY